MKDKCIRFRVTSKFKREVEQQAKKEGKTVSEYISDLIKADCTIALKSKEKTHETNI